MGETERLAAARAFVRSCNVLLKQAALYGLKHSRSGAQLTTTFTDLRNAVTGGPTLALAVSADKLQLDGTALAAGAAERSLAAYLSAAGIGRLDFCPAVTPEEFTRLVELLCAAKPAEVLAKLRPELGKNIRNIRVLEFRVVETGMLEGPRPGNGGGLAAAMPFGDGGFNLDSLLADPRKLLQLLAAPASGDGSDPHASSGGATGASTLDEADVLSSIRWLTRFADPQPNRPPDPPPETPSGLQKALQKLLPAVPSRQLSGAVLLRLAEQVALRAALEKYESGNFDVAAVQQTLERMNRELDILRQVLRAREEQMGRAGLAIENSAELLDRQFWENISEENKRKVLLSADAWVLPSYHVRSFVEPLLGGAEHDLGAAILRNYCRFLDSAEPEARRRSAAGLGKLADLYAVAGYLRSAVQRVGERISRDPSEAAPLLRDSFVLLGQEAVGRTDYPALEEWLFSLDQLRRREPALAQSVQAQVMVDGDVQQMVEGVVHQIKPQESVVEILKRMPEAAARHMAEELQRCFRREECNRVAYLFTAMGPAPIQYLREMLCRGSAREAVASVGVLALFDPEFLLQHLPPRLARMSRAEQDATVREIAATGTSERGRLLLEILHCLDPLVMPVAIDEIGIAGHVAPAKLMDLAQGQGLALRAPLLQVKSIEALGRLGDRGAAALLTRMLTARSMLGWQNPREVRVVAAQALQRIDPAGAGALVTASGLNPRELTVGPLIALNNAWVRQRKYARVRSDGSLVGSLAGIGGPSNLKVETISLGGGMASTVRDAQEGADAALDLYIGLRKLPARVLIRQTRPHQVSFEFVEISLDDRCRLRGYLAARSSAGVPAAKVRP